jgi:hypothetical protein
MAPFPLVLCELNPLIKDVREISVGTRDGSHGVFVQRFWEGSCLPQMTKSVQDCRERLKKGGGLSPKVYHRNRQAMKCATAAPMPLAINREATGFVPFPSNWHPKLPIPRHQATRPRFPSSLFMKKTHTPCAERGEEFS